MSKISRETHDRLEELRGAVDEHDRLVADLRALDVVPESLVVPEPRIVPGPPVDSKTPANVIRCPARRESLRRPLVSPKVARLMYAPRRPALERPGIARVGGGA